MRALRRLREWLSGAPARPVPVDWVRLGSAADHRSFLATAAPELERRRAVERSLVSGEEPFTVPGHCWVCARPSGFRVDFQYLPHRAPDGVLLPNWREQLLCPGCQLRNRMRATIHFLEERLAPAVDDPIFITEQMTALSGCLSRRYPNLVGSEYLGEEIGLGELDDGGIRNESLTELTFPSGSFSLVVSLEVLEHVPDFRRALAECHRVLRPEGRLLFSVPFDPESGENQVRATVDENGEVRHLLPPEYHGDPLRPEGCLAFYRFGWELLEQVRAAGFTEVNGYSFWSRDYGYLGSPLILFLARSRA